MLFGIAAGSLILGGIIYAFRVGNITTMDWEIVKYCPDCGYAGTVHNEAFSSGIRNRRVNVCTHCGSNTEPGTARVQGIGEHWMTFAYRVRKGSEIGYFKGEDVIILPEWREEACSTGRQTTPKSLH